MALTIVPLVIGMNFTPFALAVADAFGVLGIGLDLGAMVVGAALALAIRLAADGLSGAESKGLEGLLTVTAGAGRQIIFSGDWFNGNPPGEQMSQAEYRICCKVPTASPPMGLLPAAWLRRLPAKMDPFLTGPNTPGRDATQGS